MTTVAWITLASALGIPTAVGFVLRALFFDRFKAIEKALADHAKEHGDSNIRQGTRIGDLESWTVAHDAVEQERRRVDTRGIPLADEGRKGRGR